MPDGEVEDENSQIALSQAIKIEPDFEIGEEATEEIRLEHFGRRSILSMRQNLVAKIIELEKDSLYKKYSERVGEIITGEVYQVWKREILLLDDEGNELILPKSEQIPTDYFKKGDAVRAVVSKVEMRNNNPVVILSRTAPEFLERLFEMEVPEVFDGLITIKNIVRVPGERAKVAVESYDDRSFSSSNLSEAFSIASISLSAREALSISNCACWNFAVSSELPYLQVANKVRTESTC